MARIKKTANVHELNEMEFNHVKLLNIALHYNVLKDRAISSFLYYVCNSRFDYAKDQNLVFELDLDNEESRELTVKVVATETLKDAFNEN